MNKPTEPHSTTCPGCAETVEATWMVCQFCGTRLKPGNDLVIRSFAWLAVLLAFALGQVAVSAYAPDVAVAYGLLLGLPMVYVFGKAVWFRIQGTPLTWSQLRKTAVRSAAWTFVLLVVVPIVIGVTLLIFAFAVCAGLIMMR